MAGEKSARRLWDAQDGRRADRKSCVIDCLLYTSFTDSINNSGNAIEAGELKIEVKGYPLKPDGLGWDGPIMQTDFDERLLIDETNWEGGDYGAIMLKVKNSGSVAAKISLDIDVEGELKMCIRDRSSSAAMTVTVISR